MIEGNKIRLRALTKKDISKTIRWHNDLELKNLTLSHPYPVTDLQEEEWIDNIIKDKSNRNVYFGIEDKLSLELVGIIFLSKINLIHQTCWLGVFIGDNNSRGKGFGKEAVRLVTEYAFNNLNLRKVSLEVVVTNKAAISVYKKLGFVIEGEMKKQVFIQSSLQSVVIMSTFVK
ncbi:MAG: GNAT family N-acetyltransferase [Ignavibacteriales bacterium]|nr:GNAT family N-acetyltransferase [Ignavibacteriales bacterium]